MQFSRKLKQTSALVIVMPETVQVVNLEFVDKRVVFWQGDIYINSAGRLSVSYCCGTQPELAAGSVGNHLLGLSGQCDVGVSQKPFSNRVQNCSSQGDRSEGELAWFKS